MQTRFTTKGLLLLPVALTLRIPLALLAYAFGFLADLFRALESRTDRTMNMMPAPKIRKEWYEEQAKIAHARFASEIKD